VRPLGGSIDFGDTREATLARKFAEDLGCAISVTGPSHRAIRLKTPSACPRT